MIVRMWMARDVETIEADTLITDASERMARRHIRRLPVTEPGGRRLVGIITATDILHAFPPQVNPFAVVREADRTATRVSDIMRGSLLTTHPEAPIEEAAELMRSRKVGGLPVVQKEAIVGLITESDIFRAFTGLFKAPPASVRVTFDLSKGEDAFALIAQLVLRHAVRVTSLVSSQLDGRPVCVAQLSGGAVEEMLEDLWRSGHHVLNVLRRP